MEKCKHKSVTKEYKLNLKFPNEGALNKVSCDHCGKTWNAAQWSYLLRNGWWQYILIILAVLFITFAYLTK